MNTWKFATHTAIDQRTRTDTYTIRHFDRLYMIPEALTVAANKQALEIAKEELVNALAREIVNSPGAVEFIQEYDVVACRTTIAARCKWLEKE